MEGLVEAAEAAAEAGRGVLATIGVGDTLALARYYLYGHGRNATEVVADLTGWDVWQLLGQANATVVQLEQAAQALRGANSSMATLPDDLARLSAGVAGAATSVR